MGVLDERLKKAQGKAQKEIAERPYLNIDDFAARAKFPPNCTFNFVDTFKDVCTWYRNVKQVQCEDVPLWIMVRDALVDCFSKFGHSEPAFFEYVKKKIGYNRNDKQEDFHNTLKAMSNGPGMVGRLALKAAKNPNDRTVEFAKKKLDKQFAEMGAPDAEAIKTLKRTDQKTKEEDDFLKKRKEIYMRDFNLNDSSDATVLEQILNDELIVRRFNVYLEANDNKFIAGAKTEVLDRLYKAFDVLGISRGKRKDAEESAKDTFADAAETYDMLNRKSGEDLSLLFLLEEMEMCLDKYDRGEMGIDEETGKALLIERFSQNGYFSVEEIKNFFNKYKHLIKELNDKCARINL